MSWGAELWDKYGELTAHTKSGIDFLDHFVAGFIKERGVLEAEYAKNLRALVKRYTPKEAPANNRAPREEEFTHLKAYKQMLKEVGFQANQHDLLYESFSKEQYKSLQESVKRLKESRKKNMKEAEKIDSELKKAFKTMDAAKDKFRKAFEEQEKAQAIYTRAENDGQVSRNEVNKLRQAATQRSQLCDTAKGKYASQLVKTNDSQRLYYHEQLPRVINDLQALEHSRLTTMVNSFRACVEKEREVTPIIGRCLDAVDRSMVAVSPEDDAEIVIERLKSGDVPPGDFKFEDMSDPAAMLSQEAKEKPLSLNLYPRKKELERLIESAEQKLVENQKTLKGCQGLLNTSMATDPKFAKTKDCTALKTEIANRHAAIGQIEADLKAMRHDHRAIEDRLEQLRSRSPMVGSPRMIREPGRGSQSSGSLKSSSLSIGSGTVSDRNGGSGGGSPEAVYEVAGPGADHRNYRESSWEEEFDPPPPPPPMPEYTECGGGAVVTRAQALYPYEGDPSQESSIPMAEGEEFEVVTDDGSGWTHVRRMGDQFHKDCWEGFVPSSYLRML